MPDSLLRGHEPGGFRPLAAPDPAAGGGSGRGAASRVAVRTGDVALALALLGLTLPLSLLVVLALRLQGGPVLRRERREGRGGRPFELLTFRSTAPGPYGRPVPTRLGRLLRPARIDQLPVLLNLLRGDMTLVGPPPGPGEAHPSPPHRPGLTGWAGMD